MLFSKLILALNAVLQGWVEIEDHIINMIVTLEYRVCKSVLLDARFNNSIN